MKTWLKRLLASMIALALGIMSPIYTEECCYVEEPNNSSCCFGRREALTLAGGIALGSIVTALAVNAKKGREGTTGLQGDPGATGPQGDPGATGPQGDRGATGSGFEFPREEGELHFRVRPFNISLEGTLPSEISVDLVFYVMTPDSVLYHQHIGTLEGQTGDFPLTTIVIPTGVVEGNYEVGIQVTNHSNDIIQGLEISSDANEEFFNVLAIRDGSLTSTELELDANYSIHHVLLAIDEGFQYSGTFTYAPPIIP